MQTHIFVIKENKTQQITNTLLGIFVTGGLVKYNITKQTDYLFIQ